MPPSLTKNWGMPNKDRSFHESPQKAGGEGWLYSEQQQKLCHFKPDKATVHLSGSRSGPTATFRPALLSR